MNNYFCEVVGNHFEVNSSIAQIKGGNFDSDVSEGRDAIKSNGQREFQINVVELTPEETRQIARKWPNSVRFYREEKEEKSGNRSGKSLLIEVDKKTLIGKSQKLKDLISNSRKLKNV